MMMGKRKTQAKVVDGKLILSCTQALRPVVWQMDLAPAKASALEIQEEKAGGPARLTLRSQNDESVDIASFADRAQALAALHVVARALEGAQGSLNQSREQAGRARRRSFWGGLVWLGSVLAAAFVLVIVIGLVGTQILVPQVGYQTVQQTAIEPLAGPVEEGSSAPESQSAPSGVPVTADQFLSGQAQDPRRAP